ncbi:IS3 family transposase [Staphylococcus schweitzeri]|uniref:IS3 family transposase n=1 Tax=Staphylococcus schweitzeri TaxID=1654388 RepID=UPI0037D9F808
MTKNDSNVKRATINYFNSNRPPFGTREIKNELNKAGIIASRNRIGRIIKTHHLLSVYTADKYKYHQLQTNTHLIKN